MQGENDPHHRAAGVDIDFRIRRRPPLMVHAMVRPVSKKRKLSLTVGRSGGLFRWRTDEYSHVGHPLFRLKLFDCRNHAATRFILQ